MLDTDPAKLEPSRPAPFARVLVACDFSAGATRAIARAARLPLAPGGTITLLHVVPDRVPHRLRDAAEALARRHLARAAKSVAAAAGDQRDLHVNPELGHGQPYVEIIRRARAHRAELVVLGRHGRRPFRDMFLGSTAERVIRAGDLPVLVVSGPARHAYRRPLVAVDLEDTCPAVLSVALRALGPEVASATLIHAYHVPFEGFVSPTVSPGEMTALRKEYRATAARALARLEAELGETGVRWREVIARGDPRAAILAEAIRRRADLLVLGTHGRRGVAHALLGSVAERVIQAAGCDVLVARPSRVSFELP